MTILAPWDGRSEAIVDDVSNRRTWIAHTPVLMQFESTANQPVVELCREVNDVHLHGPEEIRALLGTHRLSCYDKWQQNSCDSARDYPHISNRMEKKGVLVGLRVGIVLKSSQLVSSSKRPIRRTLFRQLLTSHMTHGTW